MSGPKTDQSHETLTSLSQQDNQNGDSHQHVITTQDVATRTNCQEAGSTQVACSDMSRNPEDQFLIVTWDENDPENPYAWSKAKKIYILATAMMLILNSTMGSSLPSNAISFIAQQWNVSSQAEKVLPISVYLIGYVFGPLVWAPLSEQYGRRIINLITYTAFILSTMTCALAPSWVVFLFFRSLTGVFGSGPLVLAPGIFADIYADPQARGRAMAAYMATTLLGPLFAPIISGFVSPTIGWRWTFWIGLIYAGCVMVPTIFIPETYGPVLLQKRLLHLQSINPQLNYILPHDVQGKNMRQLITVVLMRPMRMIIFEPIVTSSCCYLALVYATFYMTFQAYPLIFQGIYGLSPGQCGLTFLSIGVGSLASLPVYWAYDRVLLRLREQDPIRWRKEEYRRLPLACLGGPIFSISLFWLGWSAREGVTFAAPMLAGIPFGLGFMLIFMALLNYLIDAYQIFAASAQAAASCCRSLLATILPLASVPMFTTLGIPEGCSLLGGVSVLMCFIPFIFIWKGERLREKSAFCVALKLKKQEMDTKIQRQKEREARTRNNLDITSAKV